MARARKRRLVNILTFTGLLVLAAIMSKLLALVPMIQWLHAFLVFAVTKILFDIFTAIVAREEKQYVFFEDYLREIVLFFAVSAVCVLSIAAVQHYMQGTVWLPMLVAAVIMIWR